MKARVFHLHKKESEWESFKNWKPEAGEFIVYDPDDIYDYPRIKMGDGVKTLGKLPFFVDSAIFARLDKHQYFDIIDGGRISEKIEYAD